MLSRLKPQRMLRQMSTLSRPDEDAQMLFHQLTKRMNQIEGSQVTVHKQKGDVVFLRGVSDDLAQKTGLLKVTDIGNGEKAIILSIEPT